MIIDEKELVKIVGFASTFDGGLYKCGRSLNANFIMNMRKENLDYCEYICGVINKNITKCTIKDRNISSNDGYNRKEQVTVVSLVHPFFTRLQNRIYIGGHKVIDLHLLKLMDAQALSILYMADGSLSFDNRTKNHYEVHLHTKGFSESDNMAISKCIYEKFNIRSTINRQGNYFYIRIKTADVGLFLDTVRPYMFKSFSYKIERNAT